MRINLVKVLAYENKYDTIDSRLIDCHDAVGCTGTSLIGMVNGVY